ncbi:MAG: RNA polymerase sigma factor, partial [Gemmatimonadota bacterium]
MPGETGSAVAHPVEGWVERFGPELRVHLGRMLSSDEDAEDVLQQVWIAAYRRPPEDAPGSNVRAWLYRVATNAALDSLSRERHRRRKIGESGPDTGMGETSPPPDAALGKLDEE